MDTPLNGQQLQQIQNETTKALQVAVDRMQLRKWAVEQAANMVCSPSFQGYMVEADGSKLPTDVCLLSQWFYDFVSKAAVVRVDITGAGK